MGKMTPKEMERAASIGRGINQKKLAEMLRKTEQKKPKVNRNTKYV